MVISVNLALKQRYIPSIQEIVQILYNQDLYLAIEEEYLVRFQKMAPNIKLKL
jgi:hypothetical protein